MGIREREVEDRAGEVETALDALMWKLYFSSSQPARMFDQECVISAWVGRESGSERAKLESCQFGLGCRCGLKEEKMRK